MKIIAYSPSNLANLASPYIYRLWELVREPQQHGGQLKWKSLGLLAREEDIKEVMVKLPEDFNSRNTRKLYHEGDLESL